MAWHAELRIEALDEAEDMRGTVRRRLRLHTPATRGPDAVEVLIHNLSLTGFLIESAADIPLGEAIAVDMPEVGATEALVVWKDGTFHGCEFERPISLAAVSAAMLRSPGEEFAPAVPHGEAPSEAIAQQRQALSPAAKTAIIIGGTAVLWALVFAALSLA